MGAAILCNAGTTPLMHASEQGHRPVAKWLLAHTNDPLALGVGAEAVRSVKDVHRRAGPLGAVPQLGRYAAPVTVANVTGQLLKCEMTTTHTYVVFRSSSSDCDDVVVDVTYKQFLVILDWLDLPSDDRNSPVAAAEAAGAWRDLPDWVVGTDEDLEGVFTRDGLRSNMDLLMRHHHEAMGGLDQNNQNNNGNKYYDDANGDAPWRDPRQLAEYHELRNGHLMALRRPEVRDHYCGRPTQAMEAASSAASHYQQQQQQQQQQQRYGVPTRAPRTNPHSHSPAQHGAQAALAAHPATPGPPLQF